MESEICSEEMKNKLDSSQGGSCLEKVSVAEPKDVELSKIVDGRVALSPITPNPGKENGEALLDCMSPLTWVSSTPTVVSVDCLRTDEVAGIDSSPQTPKEDVFDSFAPGPDELMLAPRVKKYFEETRNNVSRRLNFDSSSEVNEGSKEDDGVEVLLQEEVLLESIYKTLLDAIVSKQAEAVDADTLPLEVGFCDGFKTPTSLPHLNGIAETCPGAPMKPKSNSRNIDLGIRRKLEF